MVDQEQILTNLGLSKNEAKIYLELLNLGQTTAVEIAKKAKLHRTNVYDALERLIEKGVVAYVSKENTKYYEASNPENLMNLLKAKETELKTALPTFALNYNLAKKATTVHVSEGVQALRNSLNFFLDIGMPLYVFGVPKQAIEMIGRGFLLDYHKRRIKKKMIMNHIYNEDAKDRIQYLNTLPYTEARYLDKQYNSLIATHICGSHVAMYLYVKNPMVIHIENQDIADAYKRYFDIFWELAKK